MQFHMHQTLILHLKLNLYVFFAEKYQFYNTILAARLHLGREEWKNLMVYSHKL
jgi:hypothetical protein